MPLPSKDAAQKLGLMLLCFQWLEECLLHVACVAESNGSNFVSPNRADERRFTDVAARALSSGRLALQKWAGDEAPMLVDALERLIQRAKELARERNDFVHAACGEYGPAGEEVMYFFKRGSGEPKFVDDSRLEGLIADLRWTAEQFGRATMSLLDFKLNYEKANRGAR